MVRSALAWSRRSFWPCTAIAGASWEAAALATGRPTLTDLSRRFARPHRPLQAAVAAWCLGLLWHLLFSRP